ncbi:hypothetical protein NM688_g7282 [Phlebia brevispora]|uniref:Uncharacterized protein n=1 Tax=Phlebia brevispora TaxID=194682 RepID=A0ACC1S725_9APHY|nr:hypothetical protein NM688_g7282 [Phlebia brevispora]
MPRDWNIITGKRGCLWGALIFYFPFRILAAISFTTGILGAYPLSAKQSEAVGYIEQCTNLIARVIVFHILTVRISQIWKQRIVSCALFVSVLSLEVLSLYGVSRIRGVWYGTVMPSALAIFFLCLINIYLLITLIGLARARSLGNFSPPGNPNRYAGKPLWRIVYEEKLYFLVVIWVAQNVSSLTWLCGPKTSDAMTVVGMTNFLTIIVCGSRMFQAMTNKGSECPMEHAPSVVATVLRYQRGARTSIAADGPSAMPFRRIQKRRARESPGITVREGRVSLQLRDNYKDVIELDSFSSDAVPSTSRVSFKTVESYAPSSSSDIHACKRTPSPPP